MRVGVLAFQGDFAKHIDAVAGHGVDAVPVRTPEEAGRSDAMIIPGGESTTIGMLCDRFGLLDVIRNRITDGMPVFGTCAGAILLARDIVGSNQPRIGVLDISIRRNAYGRQRESFEADIDLSSGGTFRGVFIRAPEVERVGGEVAILGALGDTPVLVACDGIWAATFHPELTADGGIHARFLEQARQRLPGRHCSRLTE